ncbi:hypothetical protein IWX48DRAFT_464935 [Phyllosticta citricarpa]
MACRRHRAPLPLRHEHGLVIHMVDAQHDNAFPLPRPLLLPPARNAQVPAGARARRRSAQDRAGPGRPQQQALMAQPNTPAQDRRRPQRLRARGPRDGRLRRPPAITARLHAHLDQIAALARARRSPHFMSPRRHLDRPRPLPAPLRRLRLALPLGRALSQNRAALRRRPRRRPPRRSVSAAIFLFAYAVSLLYAYTAEAFAALWVVLPVETGAKAAV